MDTKLKESVSAAPLRHLRRIGGVLRSGRRPLTAGQRAVVSNMASEHGARTGIFPIDGHTLDYLRATGRDAAQVALVEAYTKAQGLDLAQLKEWDLEKRLQGGSPRGGAGRSRRCAERRVATHVANGRRRKR